MLLFANTGFTGIPVCQALYGSEGIFYAALMNSISDIFVFTVGIALIRKSTGQSVSMKAKEFLTPGLIAIIAGLLLLLTDTSLPDVLRDPIRIAGSATTPLAMITIGFYLGKISLRSMARDKRINWLILLKLIVIPIIALSIMKPMIGNFSVFTAVIVMQAAMPVATCTVIFEEQYRGNSAFTTEGVFSTTLISILTIPIFSIIVGV